MPVNLAVFLVNSMIGMPFEYSIVSYTLHLISLYSGRYGKIVLTLIGRERKIYMTYKVTNIKGNSSRDVLPSDYSSWIDYREKRTGKKAVFCNCTSCTKFAKEGAHVKVDEHGDYWYIVPRCYAHNESTYTLTVEGPLIPINSDIPILE